MENKTVTVTGCRGCCFHIYDDMGGDMCNHPDAFDLYLTFEDVVHADKSPFDCPLKQQSITIQFKEK